VLPNDVLQHLLPMPQLCRVCWDQQVFPMQCIPYFPDILFDSFALASGQTTAISLVEKKILSVLQWTETSGYADR
jgi:hypothetical protein